MTLRHIKRDELYGILNWLKQFQVLRELELDVDYIFDNIKRASTQIQRSVITLAQNLSHLESIYLSGIRLMESTVLEFLHFANNLKKIHIYGSELIFTQKFILEIVEELKSSRSQNATQPLKLFIPSWDNKAIQELDINNYLRINK